MNKAELINAIDVSGSREQKPAAFLLILCKKKT